MMKGVTRQSLIDDLTPFLAVVEHRSFTRAAVHLGVDTSSVSRAIARLERRTGVTLLARNSRAVSVTTAGNLLIASARDILARVDVLESELRQSVDEPSGVLRITAPRAYGAAVLAPHLGRFVDRYPRLEVQLSLTDRWVDLMVEGVDVAIRIGILTDSGLIARRIDHSRFVTVAAPGYLEDRGVPRDRKDLFNHRCIGFTMLSGRTRNWSFLDRRGRELEVHLPFVLTLDDGRALIDQALAGVGIIQAPEYLVAERVESGDLVEILPGTGAITAEIYCVHQPSRAMASKVRAFATFTQAVAETRRHL